MFKEDVSKFSLTLLWLIANICAENNLFIHQSVLKSSLYPFILLNTRSASKAIKKEATWALVNLTTGSDIELVSAIVQMDGMSCLINVLWYEEDPILLNLALEGVKCILKHGDDFSELNNQMNPFKFQFEKENGNLCLEKLLKHPHKNVYEDSKELMNKYYGDICMQEDDYFRDS